MKSSSLVVNVKKTSKIIYSQKCMSEISKLSYQLIHMRCCIRNLEKCRAYTITLSRYYYYYFFSYLFALDIRCYRYIMMLHKKTFSFQSIKMHPNAIGWEETKLWFWWLKKNDSDSVCRIFCVCVTVIYVRNSTSRVYIFFLFLVYFYHFNNELRIRPNDGI